ncbi:hypothetical protein CDV55_100520 [Aspergillus turcosus]|nr:hypothetical protein CDV55_100520 [Aspergillus turcosus]
MLDGIPAHLRLGSQTRTTIQGPRGMNESSVGEHRLVSEQKLIFWTWLGKTIRARDGERAVMFWMRIKIED